MKNKLTMALFKMGMLMIGSALVMRFGKQKGKRIYDDIIHHAASMIKGE